ncbi:hypothetical protein EMCRGX_G004021 [Ephydatia muelleri]
MAESSRYRSGTWSLYYWPGFRGRGDYARLMFEVAGVKYRDVCNDEKNADSVLKYEDSGEDFILSQSVSILHFLGTQFGLCPVKPEDDAHALQIALTVADYISEGHDAFHPIKKTGTYESQKEEAKPFIEYFKSTRLPRYMKHFEDVYTRCRDVNKYFFNSKTESEPTYADIAVYHALCATKASFEDWNEIEYPRLLEFKQMMDEHERIKEYNGKDTTQKYCGNSLM